VSIKEWNINETYGQLGDETDSTSCGGKVRAHNHSIRPGVGSEGISNWTSEAIRWILLV